MVIYTLIRGVIIMIITRKGISPLIAAVLLIAFTMAIAAILTTWISNFTTDQKEKTQVFEEKIDCVYQSIRADPDFARINMSTKIFQDYVVNTGSVDVELTGFQVWIDDTPIKPYKMNGTLPKESGVDVNLNLSIPLAGGGELTQIKFTTRCEAVSTTVWKPVSGWAKLTGTITEFNGPI